MGKNKGRKGEEGGLSGSASIYVVHLFIHGTQMQMHTFTQASKYSNTAASLGADIKHKSDRQTETVASRKEEGGCHWEGGMERSRRFPSPPPHPAKPPRPKSISFRNPLPISFLLRSLEQDKQANRGQDQQTQRKHERKERESNLEQKQLGRSRWGPLILSFFVSFISDSRYKTDSTPKEGGGTSRASRTLSFYFYCFLQDLLALLGSEVLAGSLSPLFQTAQEKKRKEKKRRERCLLSLFLISALSLGILISKLHMG
mmetsp:Transcript_13792/g.27437  ORF Transcript_13792/g.27437 Transcript_13792/m.27437 type:complete len:258 (-) Transcript_13792:1535-2308(-)